MLTGRAELAAEIDVLEAMVVRPEKADPACEIIAVSEGWRHGKDRQGETIDYSEPKKTRKGLAMKITGES